MRIVIQSSYGNLEAHRPQLTGFHFSGQSLQGSFHKQGYALDSENIHTQWSKIKLVILYFNRVAHKHRWHKTESFLIASRSQIQRWNENVKIFNHMDFVTSCTANVTSGSIILCIKIGKYRKCVHYKVQKNQLIHLSNSNCHMYIMKSLVPLLYWFGF